MSGQKMNRFLLAAILLVGCKVPFEPLPPTEVDNLAKQYDAVVVERRDLEAGTYQTYARLLDDSQVWRSNGRNVTDCFQNRIVNAAVAKRRLSEAMRQGVERSSLQESR